MKAKHKARAPKVRIKSLPVAGKARFNSYNSRTQPVASSGGQYGAQDFAKSDTEYLTMVVQRFDNQWSYVRVNTHCLDIISEPCVFEMSAAEELLEIWKRVVLDNAIPWEDNIRPETLRIVHYRPCMVDVTLSLFNDDAEIQEFLKILAMSKLSDAEASLLGAQHLKAKQKLLHNPSLHRDDVRTLTNLQKISASLPLSIALSSLHED